MVLAIAHILFIYFNITDNVPTYYIVIIITVCRVYAHILQCILITYAIIKRRYIVRGVYKPHYLQYAHSI